MQCFLVPRCPVWGAGQGHSTGVLPEADSQGPGGTGPSGVGATQLPLTFSFKVVNCETVLTSDWNLQGTFLGIHVSEPDFSTKGLLGRKFADAIYFPLPRQMCGVTFRKGHGALALPTFTISGPVLASPCA